MPPSLVEWLPEDHLVWTVLGAVDQMDLSRFREGYRLGGTGRAPYDPKMQVVALLLYAYARGNRSSRRIERACLEDVAYKVITSMRVPDHSTVAEFRLRVGRYYTNWTVWSNWRNDRPAVHELRAWCPQLVFLGGA